MIRLRTGGQFLGSNLAICSGLGHSLCVVGGGGLFAGLRLLGGGSHFGRIDCQLGAGDPAFYMTTRGPTHDQVQRL